ncbi:MAG: homoserine kinase [Oceanococcus sp.]
MSVFTPVSEPELTAYLKNYELGELRQYRGIEEGIENSNFFLSTSQGEFVLTLFERTPEKDLPYFLGVMNHLSAAGIPSAGAMTQRNGQILGRLNGRASAIVERLPGAGVDLPNASQGAALGGMLARLHVAAADFSGQRNNCRASSWWTPELPRLLDVLPAEQAQLLQDEVAFQAAHAQEALPGGVIHADLFRDNALFDGDKLTGIIDFYYACNDAWLYDLAVCVNDWAINATGQLQVRVYQALVTGYQQQRALSEAEQAAWPVQLRRAALRFWLSRLLDWHFPRGGELTYSKDPAEFERVLRDHRAQVPSLLG